MYNNKDCISMTKPMQYILILVNYIPKFQSFVFKFLDKCFYLILTKINYCNALGVVAEWSKVVRLPHIVIRLALGTCTYQFSFAFWVFHVIFSFVHFISFDTLGGRRDFRITFNYSIFVLQIIF